jgi:signal transduction histidine kinase
MADEPRDLVRSLDTISGVLGGLTTEPSETVDVFYDALCEAICSLTTVRRAVIFLWDGARSTVRPAGAHEVDISVFADEFVDVDLLPAARRALETDSVVESTDHPTVTERFGALVNNRTLIVTPMVAGGRWVGVIVGDRLPDAGAFGAGERHLLWTLGKTAALAATARSATRQTMRARELEARIDLAREIHNGVVQRLFGVSLALAGNGEFDAEIRERCSDEIQAALSELRDAVQRPLGRRSPPTSATLSGELRRLEHEHAGLGLKLTAGDPSSVPTHLEPLVQSVVVEAIRNAQKHAEPSAVEVSVQHSDRTLVLEITNDGTTGRESRSGMGLRLAGLEALQYGGLLEFGPEVDDRWRVRLTVPDEQ